MEPSNSNKKSEPARHGSDHPDQENERGYADRRDKRCRGDEKRGGEIAPEPLAFCVEGLIHGEGRQPAREW